MEKWKKYIYKSIGIVSLFFIAFAACGGLKTEGVDKTLRDSKEMIAVMEKYLDGDMSLSETMLAHKAVEEIYDRDRTVWTWEVQEESRDDYIDGFDDGVYNMENYMDMIKHQMCLLSSYKKSQYEGDKKEIEELLPEVYEYVEKLRESTIPKTE